MCIDGGNAALCYSAAAAPARCEMSAVIAGYTSLSSCTKYTVHCIYCTLGEK